MMPFSFPFTLVVATSLLLHQGVLGGEECQCNIGFVIISNPSLVPGRTELCYECIFKLVVLNCRLCTTSGVPITQEEDLGLQFTSVSPKRGNHFVGDALSPCHERVIHSCKTWPAFGPLKWVTVMLLSQFAEQRNCVQNWFSTLGSHISAEIELGTCGCFVYLLLVWF